MNGKEERELKKSEAIARQEKYDKMTIDQKISLVKSRGGSKKELERLIKLKESAGEKK